MRTKHLFGVLGVGALAAALIAACGSTTKEGETGAGGGAGSTSSGTTTTTTTTTTSTTTTPTGTGGEAGQPGDGNESFAEAQDVTIGDKEGFSGELDPVDTDYDYYKFAGKKGQVLFFLADAKPDDDPYADGYPDLVITLYDSDKQQIAENDDPIPRNTQDSQLYTVLPDDGDYYVRVGDFCLWLEGQGDSCPPGVAEVTEPGYTVWIIELDPAEEGNVSEAEGAMEYKANPNGGYYASAAWGTFGKKDEVDTFTFSVPKDAPVNDGRATAYIEVYPSGSTGNGSTVPTGDVSIVDPETKETIGLLDATKVDVTFGMSLSTPVAFGKSYELKVSPEAGKDPGSNPFYFVLHYAGGSNPIETDEKGNDDPLNKVEKPELQQSSNGVPVYWFAGDIINGATDLDHYVLSLSGVDQSLELRGGCFAQRIGSGLRKMKFSLLKGKDQSVIKAMTENPDKDEGFVAGDEPGLPFPTNEKELIFKVEAGSQDDVVKGTYYSCYLGFFEAQQ
ncbi:MAG: hypothetical protein HY744_26715 [Deltaproteobacteria bacterium]|nr:hypothetical protein [Deltaproteobacteria bacterium]